MPISGWKCIYIIKKKEKKLTMLFVDFIPVVTHNFKVWSFAKYFIIKTELQTLADPMPVHMVLENINEDISETFTHSDICCDLVNLFKCST